MNDDDLDTWSVLYLVIFVLLYSHVKGKLFLQKLLLDEESSRRQRLGVISVLIEPSNYILFEKLVSIKNKKLSFLFIQVTVVVTLSTKSGCASGACHIQQASLRNGKEVVAALTYNGPIESMEVLIATFVVLVWSFTAFKLGFVLHELLEMRKSLLEC